MTGLLFRLPTEAEWEYACRAGTTTEFYSGTMEDVFEDSDLDEVGWYRQNSDRRTRPVARKMPNEWQIYDMHGNVWEWCQDWYEEYVRRHIDNPTGPILGDFRVSRGGGYISFAVGCRAANREKMMPEYRSQDQGFRLAADF
jgi:formylglycine-generating enzyme required for sulfatase activity